MKKAITSPARLVKGALVALVLALSAVLLAPAPAQALTAGTMTFCLWVENDKGEVEYKCFTIDVPVAGPKKWWPGDECWVCGPAYRFDDAVISPGYLDEFQESLAKGVALLAEAGVTDDEKAAAELRDQAADAFYAAAATVNEKDEVALLDYGWIDPDTGTFYSEPLPTPLKEAGTALESGLELMHTAVYDPEPLPWIEAAMKEFDQANASLAELAAG